MKLNKEQFTSILIDLFWNTEGCSNENCKVCPRNTKNMLDLCETLDFTLEESIGMIPPWLRKYVDENGKVKNCE